MADHWKSIANLLGAPGMDEPEEVAETPAKSEPIPAPQSTPKVPETQADSGPDTSDENATVEEDSPSDAFEVERSAKFDLPETEELQPRAEVETPPPVPKAVEEATQESTKPKRKSSWEALASMFNLSVQPEPAAPPPPTAAQESSAAKTPEPPASKLGIFDSDKEEPVNPALDKMFGDAPRAGSDAWGSKRRMIDDVSWEDDEPASRDVESELPAEASGASAGGSDEEEGETQRRGRRRRRGRGRGNRDRSDSPRSEEQPRGEVDSDPELDEEPIGWGLVDDSDTSSGESSKDFSEDAGGEVERRSSRRRRRGRSRQEGEVAEGGSVESPRTREPERSREHERAREPDRSRDAGRGRDSERARRPERTARLPEVDRTDSADLDEDLGDRGEPEVTRRPRPEREEEGGGRRRRRRRPSGPRVESESDLDENQGVVESGYAEGDAEASNEEKHRNIPTWIDALQPMIDANTENHRKNDNRGGPRGRPRGRR